MSTDTIAALDRIDRAIAGYGTATQDWATSGDAMRWTPDGGGPVADPGCCFQCVAEADWAARREREERQRRRFCAWLRANRIDPMVTAAESTIVIAGRWVKVEQYLSDGNGGIRLTPDGRDVLRRTHRARLRRPWPADLPHPRVTIEHRAPTIRRGVEPAALPPIPAQFSTVAIRMTRLGDGGDEAAPAAVVVQQGAWTPCGYALVTGRRHPRITALRAAYGRRKGHR